ncbi:FAD-binding monooxygenase aflW [Pseudocercospora fuligena]|uniref:FAD-binding monooxygenase aflW n=1 Tax=Pseudocercospora fuligena TaxID=685502 RepID=A0A8H6VRB3_9PEZI|nr:FAD-binding monooxygenase aflW [Pseudocercospora fuligena]
MLIMPGLDAQSPQAYSPFEIPFNPRPQRSPRRLKIVCIGAGFAGLTLAYKFCVEKKLEGVVDFCIYEKQVRLDNGIDFLFFWFTETRQHDVGGTWLANSYPGLTCDVPVHNYTLPWAPKHDWTRFMAGREEILNYIKEVTCKFELNRCITFNAQIQSATWDEDRGKWKLLVHTKDGDIEEDCDILIGAAGTQATPSTPKIPGIETFRGTVVHTGCWDETLDCKDKRIAVIGNGSSGIQVVAALQKQAKHIAHYIRSPTWISPNYMSQFTRNADGRNFEYTTEEIATYQDPKALFTYRKTMEKASNGIFKNLVFNDTAADVKKKFRETLEKTMKDRLHHDPELIEHLVPTYQPWCRRLTPGDSYLEALQEPNAQLITDPISRITPTGIRTTNDTETNYDIIITATGYTNTRVPPWTMTGRNGISLASRFSKHADGYLSLCAPNMPNYFTPGCGPNFTIANGPVLTALTFCADYIISWCEKIAHEDIHSICVKDSVVEAYNIYIQQVFSAITSLQNAIEPLNPAITSLLLRHISFHELFLLRCVGKQDTMSVISTLSWLNYNSFMLLLTNLWQSGFLGRSLSHLDIIISVTIEFLASFIPAVSPHLSGGA